MKRINKTSLLFSFIILIVVFCVISIIAAPTEIRYTWHGINPWNTVQAVPLMFKRFLKTDDWIIYSLSVLIVVYIWWRIYALVNRFKNNRKQEQDIL